MLEGLYAAAAGMMAQQNQLDATSQNIANEDTTGYQSVQVGFESLLYSTDNDDPSTALVGAGAASSDVGYNQTQGALQETNNTLDLALEGDGFFQVRLSNGQNGLTRAGDLQLNAKGQITTSEGQLLEPPITVPNGTKTSQIQVATDGTVTVAGKQVGKIAVVNVPAPNGLQAVSDTTYAVTSASGAATAAKGTTIQQGYLEQSNTDLDVEISDMESAQQGYSMDSKAIEIEAQMGQIAAELK